MKKAYNIILVDKSSIGYDMKIQEKPLAAGGSTPTGTKPPPERTRARRCYPAREMLKPVEKKSHFYEEVEKEVIKYKT